MYLYTYTNTHTYEYIHTLSQNNERPIADYHEFATVCFLDIVSFTAMAGDMPSTELVALLDHLFSQFDEVAELFNVTKIKTVGGDSYAFFRVCP